MSLTGRRVRRVAAHAVRVVVVFCVALVAPAAIAGPDLVSSVTSLPASASAGSSISIGYSVQNTGNATTGAQSGLKLYLSSNTTLDGADTYLSPSVSTPILGAGNSVSGSVSRTVPAGTASGQWYILSQADGFSAIAEDSETNNVGSRGFSVSCTAPAAPSLSSPSSGATVTSSPVTLSWGSVSGATSYDVYFGTSSTNMTVVTNTTSTSYSRNVTNGTYYWKVHAKGSCGETGSSTRNFTVALCSLGTFDHVAPSNGYSVDPPSTSIYLVWRLSSGATAYDVYFGTATNPPLHAQDVSGDRLQVSINYNTTYRWRVVAKNGSSCTLNSSSGTWSFTNPPQPTVDLIAAITAITPGNVLPGGTITANYQITNQGTLSAPQSQVKVWLSNDSTLDGTDVLLGTQTALGLGPGMSYVGSVTATVPANTPPGVRYVIAQADSANQIAESNENNNTGFNAFQVDSPPAPTDLVATSIDISPAGQITEGTDVTITGVITNAGGTTSGPFNWTLSVNANLVDSGRPASLAPGGQIGSSTISWTGKLPEGSPRIDLIVDTAFEVAESDEGNNSRTQYVQVLGGAVPVPTTWGSMTYEVPTSGIVLDGQTYYLVSFPSVGRVLVVRSSPGGLLVELDPGVIASVIQIHALHRSDGSWDYGLSNIPAQVSTWNALASQWKQLHIDADPAVYINTMQASRISRRILLGAAIVAGVGAALSAPFTGGGSVVLYVAVVGGLVSASASAVALVESEMNFYDSIKVEDSTYLAERVDYFAAKTFLDGTAKGADSKTTSDALVAQYSGEGWQTAATVIGHMSTIADGAANSYEAARARDMTRMVAGLRQFSANGGAAIVSDLTERYINSRTSKVKNDYLYLLAWNDHHAMLERLARELAHDYEELGEANDSAAVRRAADRIAIMTALYHNNYREIAMNPRAQNLSAEDLREEIRLLFNTYEMTPYTEERGLAETKAAAEGSKMMAWSDYVADTAEQAAASYALLTDVNTPRPGTLELRLADSSVPALKPGGTFGGSLNLFNPSGQSYSVTGATLAGPASVQVVSVTPPATIGASQSANVQFSLSCAALQDSASVEALPFTLTVNLTAGTKSVTRQFPFRISSAPTVAIHVTPLASFTFDRGDVVQLAIRTEAPAAGSGQVVVRDWTGAEWPSQSFSFASGAAQALVSVTVPQSARNGAHSVRVSVAGSDMVREFPRVFTVAPPIYGSVAQFNFNQSAIVAERGDEEMALRLASALRRPSVVGTSGLSAAQLMDLMRTNHLLLLGGHQANPLVEDLVYRGKVPANLWNALGKATIHVVSDPFPGVAPSTNVALVVAGYAVQDTMLAGVRVLGEIVDASRVLFHGDFDGNGRDDILLRNSQTGEIGIWFMNGSTIAGGGLVGPSGNSTVAGIADFNGDGRDDVLLRDATGTIGMWLMNGTVIASGGLVGSPGAYSVAGAADFDGNGKADILLRDSAGNLGMWLMNGTAIQSGAFVGSPGAYSVAAVRDFSGDGKSDILLRDSLGNLGLWAMNGATIASGALVGSPGAYTVAGSNDFNGDGRADILLRDSLGNLGMWLMNGATISSGAFVASPGAYSVVGVGDYDGNGRADVLLRDGTGTLGMWLMNGSSIVGGGQVGSPGTTFDIY